MVSVRWCHGRWCHGRWGDAGKVLSPSPPPVSSAFGPSTHSRFGCDGLACWLPCLCTPREAAWARPLAPPPASAARCHEPTNPTRPPAGLRCGRRRRTGRAFPRSNAGGVGSSERKAWSSKVAVFGQDRARWAAGCGCRRPNPGRPPLVGTQPSGRRRLRPMMANLAAKCRFCRLIEILVPFTSPGAVLRGGTPGGSLPASLKTSNQPAFNSATDSVDMEVGRNRGGTLGLRSTVWKCVLIGGMCVIAVYFALPNETSQDIVYSALGTASVVCILVGIRLQRPKDRLSWYFLALAGTCFTLGDDASSFYNLVLHVSVPFPSFADALYLAGYPFLFAGVLRLTRNPNGRRGDASSFYSLVLHVSVPFPSFADALYLAGYPFLFAGVLRLTRNPNRSFRREKYTPAP